MASSYSILLCFLCLVSFSSIIPPSDSADFISSANEAKSKISDVIASIEKINNGKQESSSGFNKIILSLNKRKESTVYDVIERLIKIAKLSIDRAQALKKVNEFRSGKRTKVFPKSYGEFDISLSFGTPPQKLDFIVDTGSDLVWFPCTKDYTCVYCNATPAANLDETPEMPKFNPEKSSSAKIANCDNPICGYLHETEESETACTNCNPGSDSGCTESCPFYSETYGSGESNGTLLSETLMLGDAVFPNFMVGCATASYNLAAGIVGFGRDTPSLPSQMKLRKFSHCFISRRFNDTSKSSSLVLHKESDSVTEDEKADGILYTPFIDNDEFPTFYYLGFEKITVGEKVLDIPEEYLSIGSEGSGGTIIDSGTTFTYMEKRIFDMVTSEIDSQMAGFKRAEDMETTVNLFPCYEVPKGANQTSFPALGFHFKGGVKMYLPVDNTFWFIDSKDTTTVACLALISGDGSGPVDGGPSIIFGNFQQQNFYVEYDLRNKRLGFRVQDCSDY